MPAICGSAFPAGLIAVGARAQAEGGKARTGLVRDGEASRTIRGFEWVLKADLSDGVARREPLSYALASGSA